MTPTKPLKIVLVAGARPNFMKVGPLVNAMKGSTLLEPYLVHTGQHYDREMSQLFFDELHLPEPDRSLGIGSGSHAQQTARIMESFETVLLEEKPAAVVLVGDVNSTVAGALVASKLRIPVAHVEAGLRSYDRTMPEEINRIVTDQLSDWLFIPSMEAEDNLLKEGIAKSRIYFVGNIMIDTLVRFLPLTDTAQILKQLGLDAGSYTLVTLHRPSNVDEPDRLDGILEALAAVAAEIPVVFPVHPRTRSRIIDAGWEQRIESLPGFRLLQPLGYLDFMALQRHARLALTDSGGIQEETTHLRVPCLTFRPNTERPITISMGTNRLLGEDPRKILPAVREILKQPYPPQAEDPPLWDGKTAPRIVKVLEESLAGSGGN
ncbi:MAG: UDP-N-acetylglucosamine 2-epimerase (non-hydrolyzing) [Candidatus Eisenbacteria bacterium]|uniref:UDP-N-acetylglucosamine 2-epimerase (Non-hydrolyzing) n=1 Tax=Eiseniibacteriota bacterium TaxID=2212470 RepID=A0A948RVI1_UNCEI|nr:UDP-N-acetylglucosamine 2-epimerase (non-hydrolyzing) [Candidatus Eisenbacteria bacterium]MBU1948751.1 UDP-N-acetylglucosamine 2-epimerase (non-hydrolyzing) [Candidatus Eisenbacteria bacterium]MBU2690464.1 UDP-N-acetylglucosamine 2-epimerase (non-hydrolyzing) [Candidatus Eisenbacteria bacterium]